MAKKSKGYLVIDPWIIRESGFHPERAKTSESIFALANERMGARGSFEEGFSGDCLPGNYFNGIYEKGKHQYSTKFKGFADHWTFMVNGPDWLYTRIILDEETLDLAKCRFTDFQRQIDMRRAILERSFTWVTASGKSLKLHFERFLSMSDTSVGAQRITATALNFSGQMEIHLAIDYGTLYDLRQNRPWKLDLVKSHQDWTAAIGLLPSSGHRIFSAFRVNASCENQENEVREESYVGRRLVLQLSEKNPAQITRMALHYPEKNPQISQEELSQQGLDEMEKRNPLDYDTAKDAHIQHWEAFWKRHDLIIEGDAENQQGFRYCIFHLHQTYHGDNPRCNIGAKGLTGEHYWGVTWWDTETYCLPYYLFNDRPAARNLVEYRHFTLDGARERARQLHLPGARYPMCTIDGEEICDVWQHGDLEIHVPAAVAYGVWKYHHLTNDDAFLFEKGAEILVEIARFYSARGGWGQQTGRFGFWGVMGADEMHMMVHNNAYTNFMAKKSLQWAAQTVDRMEREVPEDFLKLKRQLKISPSERADWKDKAEAMELMYRQDSGLYEQHEGYFNMPHLDYAAIPDDQFPVQKTWPYIDLFRFDLIKQPDVLLFLYLFPDEFDRDTLQNNFDYYEPRCSHESSLSPAIHSILAARLGHAQKSFEYAKYASRLDLDDYNNNTWEGLHVTSMAGAWMNLVYGFGGLQSDGEQLHFHPSCPKKWKSFSFNLFLEGNDVLSVRVDQKTVSFKMNPGDPKDILVFDRPYKVDQEGMTIPIQNTL